MKLNKNTIVNNKLKNNLKTHLQIKYLFYKFIFNL